jgi:LysR family glycine cleavage system transcriptional activator
MRGLPPFAPLKAFFAAAETGRFRLAAEMLGLTESAVSHQVRRLEEYLGAALFERHGRTLRLSPAGARYHLAVRPAFLAIRAATEEFSAAPRRRVTLTLPSSIAAFWLMPRLPRWQEQHPEIDLQIVATNRLVDLAREQLDLGLRYGGGAWRGYDVRPLMPEQSFPVASPEFLARRKGADPAALMASSRIIVNSLHPEEWQEWCAAHGLPPPQLKDTITLSSAEMAVPAMLNGVGIGMGRRPIIDPLLEAGRLVPLFGARTLERAAYYLVWPESRPLSRPVKAVAEWLEAEGRSSDSGRPATIGARRKTKRGKAAQPR